MACADDQSQETRIKYLSQPDAEVLDALLAARAADGPGPMPAGSKPRADRLARLLTLLDTGADEKDDADPKLVDRTLERVQEVRQRERFAMQVQMLAGDNGQGGFGWREVGSVAAIILLTLTLMVPVVSRSRIESRRIACQANLGGAYAAFATYAQDHQGYLPRGAVQPGTPWFVVGGSSKDGTVRSNSANLYLLVRGRYADAHDLACPANPHAPQHGELTRQHHDWARAESVSYSYQNQYTPRPIRMGADLSLALLADKNPLFSPSDGDLRFDRAAPRVAPSRMHRGMGQNVLTADGRAVWMARPMVHRPGDKTPDNIWLISGVREYKGTEVPTSPGDSFLVP